MITAEASDRHGHAFGPEQGQAADRLARLVGAPVTVGAGRVAAGPVALAAATKVQVW